MMWPLDHNNEPLTFDEILDLACEGDPECINALTQMVSYDEAIQTARDLIDDGSNTEYTRGQVELIGDLWGKFEMPLSERKFEIARDIGVKVT